MRRLHAHRTCAYRGLTLLEVVLSIGLLVVLLATMFFFHANSLKTAREGATRTRDAQLGRVILQQISDEIRQANGYLTSTGPGIVGRSDEIAVYALVVPDKQLFERRELSDDQIPAQHDVRQVQYSLAWDEDNETEDGEPICLGLVRREQRTLNQSVIIENKDDTKKNAGKEDVAQDVRLELYAPEIKYLRFAYLDGTDWVSSWQPGAQAGNSLPQAIRVTVGYTPVVLEEDAFGLSDKKEELEEDFIPPPDSFTMIVRLPMATEAAFGSRAVGLKTSLGGALGGGGL